MFSILLLEPYQHVGKQKVILDALGDVKRDEYQRRTVLKVCSNVKRLFSIHSIWFLCSHSFKLALLGVMNYLNFGGVTVQIRHTTLSLSKRLLSFICFFFFFSFFLIDVGVFNTGKSNLSPSLSWVFLFCQQDNNFCKYQR